MGKRLASIYADNTEQNRAALREMLFTSQSIEQYISGVILYEETLFQHGSNGQRLVEHLTSKGVLLGIKVDTGGGLGGMEQWFGQGLVWGRVRDREVLWVPWADRSTHIVVIHVACVCALPFVETANIATNC